MSFARGLYLGKPELPIDHVHIYFPAQIAHKVIAQCKALKLKEIALTAAERYKHNVDNAANNPYVIVGVFEGKCSHEQYPPIPATPTLARAYEEGMLDASFGHFASFYQTSFRVEVPLWHKLEDGIAAPSLLAPRCVVVMAPIGRRLGREVQRSLQRRKRQRKKAMSLPLGKDVSPLR